MDVNKAFDFLSKNISYVKTSFEDAIAFYAQRKNFFHSIFDRNIEDIVKELTFCISLIIVIVAVVDQPNFSSIKLVFKEGFLFFVTDFPPIFITIYIVCKFTGKAFSFKEYFPKVILFLLYNYIFIGGLIAGFARYIENSDNYRINYFVLNVLCIIFFGVKHIFSGNIFFDKKHVHVLFAITNFIVFNTIYAAITILSIVNEGRIQPIVFTDKLKIFDNSVLNEWNNYTLKSGGKINSDKLPLAILEMTTMDNKHSSVYAFYDGIVKTDTNTYYNDNYKLTVELLRDSKRRVDSLNSYLGKMKYNKNLYFFTQKRDVYQTIIDGVNPLELYRGGLNTQSDSVNLLVVEPTGKIFSKIQEANANEGKFLNDTKIAYIPQVIFFNTYFVIVLKLSGIIGKVGDYGPLN